MTIRRRLLRFMRKLHIWVGLSAALYFMLIATTGVMINHREGLRLEERNVSRSWLPNGYRAQDGSAVRADIVVTDLHSGLIFGKVGAPVLDFVAAVWFISIISGVSMLILRRSMHYTQSKKVYLPSPTASEQKAPAASAEADSRKALAGAGRSK
jgi:uncharacterized iron-regulated membrane protein